MSVHEGGAYVIHAASCAGMQLMSFTGGNFRDREHPNLPHLPELGILAAKSPGKHPRKRGCCPRFSVHVR